MIFRVVSEIVRLMKWVVGFIRVVVIYLRAISK